MYISVEPTQEVKAYHDSPALLYLPTLIQLSVK